MPTDNVNEGTSAYLTFSFLDKDEDPIAPTSISYRIDCLKNSTEILEDTPVTPPAAEAEVKIPSSLNSIINQANHLERRLVTVTGTFGDDDDVVGEYEYNVKNMRKKP